MARSRSATPRVIRLTRCSMASARSGVARALHGTQLLLQVLHLVAQPRGEFELELSGGGEHLVREVFDGRLELCRAFGRDSLAAQPWRRGFALAGLVLSRQQVGGVRRLTGERIGDV